MSIAGPLTHSHVTGTHQQQVAAGERFSFGANWLRFLALVDESRIRDAERSLQRMLGTDRLDGRSFLDVGSGSGLFSLAALRLGAARVHSLDFDPDSVACTGELKRRFAPEASHWTIESGSALDDDYLGGLGLWDVVYSWGVLHHTADMRRGLTNAARATAPGGQLFVAIYNDQGWISSYWHSVKRLYNRSSFWKVLMVAFHAPYLVGARAIVRRLRNAGALDRGMSLWHDMLDWLGGYPFEVASPEWMRAFGARMGLRVEREVLCGRRHGCNEFVFVRAGDARD